MQCLKRATDVLFSSNATFGKLKSAIDNIYDLFTGITQLGSEPDPLRGCQGTILPEGTALSPKEAARCILDSRRTTMFLRGLQSAISEASVRFSGEPINILYAGCGPFAPFCILPLLQSPAINVQFTLLDIHQRSLDAARQLAEILCLQERIRDYIRCDAASYQHARGPVFHVILTETLQAALRGEAQVAITANLAPMVRAGGFFLPEQIFIEACLLNQTKEFTCDRQGTQANTIELPMDYIHLGQVFELSAKTTCHPQPVDVTIPKLAVDHYTLALLTRITVFGPHKLGPYDSGLTCPVLLREVRASDSPAIVRFTYQRGERPGFGWRLRSLEAS